MFLLLCPARPVRLSRRKKCDAEALFGHISSAVDRAISILIRWSGDRYFRWHDLGDLQDLVHLRNIIAVCRNLPDVKFWLPTREYQTVEAYRKSGSEIPPNLCIRYSAHFVDGSPPLRYGLPTSTISSVIRAPIPGTYRCPALQQGSRCGVFPWPASPPKKV
jgi:hypothetical protein